MDFAQNFSNFTNGLNTFLIGVVVVLSTLFLLIGMIVLISKIVGSIDKRSKDNKINSTPIKEVVKSEEVVPIVETKLQDELELVAVITAAIAAAMGTTSDRLQVKTLRKVERKAL